MSNMAGIAARAKSDGLGMRTSESVKKSAGKCWENARFRRVAARSGEGRTSRLGHDRWQPSAITSAMAIVSLHLRVTCARKKM
jgi:hypothetical protein